MASSEINDVKNQILIQKWLTIALLKNAFGSSSDTTLKNLQDTLNEQSDYSVYPYVALNKRLNIEPNFNDAEIENLISTNYSTKYSYLILSLLYPNRDWKDNKYHEDHIFPKSEFSVAKLKRRGYEQEKIDEYRKYFNSMLNLQLLTDSENLEKSSKSFDSWFSARDTNFKSRHKIPTIDSYNFDNFLDFIEERKKLIIAQLKTIEM